MLQKIYILFFMLCISGGCFAQKSYRDYIRSGNKLYNDSVFVKAEVDYRKALEKNPQSTDAMFNLTNSLLMQQKAKEAMQMYHNMGVILQTSKKYPECIEMYKESMKRNPKDNETRYNLALAQKMLKDQQQQQNKDKKDQKKQDQKDDKKDQNKKDQNKDKNQNQNNNNKQQQNKSQMSKENAEQLLNAVTQDEKDIQDKVKKQIQIQGKKLDKDW